MKNGKWSLENNDFIKESFKLNIKGIENYESMSFS